MGADLFYADGQTHRQTDRRTGIRKLVVASRNFERTPKNVYKLHYSSYVKEKCAVILACWTTDDLLHWKYLGHCPNSKVGLHKFYKNVAATSKL